MNKQTKAVLFSFIQPVVKLNDYVYEAYDHLAKLEEDYWELIVIVDQTESWRGPQDSRVKILNSGKVSPARKRDIGAEAAIGRTLVFIDDDAYPNRDFLRTLNEYSLIFEHFAIVGPAITPPDAGIREVFSGTFYESSILNPTSFRYTPRGNIKCVDDYPTVNFSINRNLFLSIGGFNTDFWPGEDTLFCLKLKENGIPIVYIPSLLMNHHRRTSFKLHLKQVASYGLHRGNFARYFPGNSRNWTYFLPSLFTSYLIILPVALKLSSNMLFSLTPLILYLVLLFASIFEMVPRYGFKSGFILPFYALSSHIVYGLLFAIGLLKGKHTSRLRDTND
jgi:GT2 family glycosyltransferase